MTHEDDIRYLDLEMEKYILNHLLFFEEHFIFLKSITNKTNSDIIQMNRIAKALRKNKLKSILNEI